MLAIHLPRHPYLTEDGYEVDLPGGKRGAAVRTWVRGYAMTLRTYFDGSGKEDDPNSKLITLVGMAAPLVAWDWLESKWAAVLWKHNVCASHMSKVMQFEDGFSRERGWTSERREIFLRDLENVLLGFGEQPNVFFVATSVDLEAHAHVIKQQPTIAINGVQQKYPKPSTLCAFYCLNFLCWRSKQNTYELFFDRNEAFFDKLYRPWNRRRKDSDERLKRVSRMSVGNIDFDIPLQASDYFAWHINRFWTKRDRPASDRLSELAAVSSIAFNIHELSDLRRIELALRGTWDV